MEKQVYRIYGFVDLGSAKVGQRMTFVDDKGQWRKTSEIINAQIAGDKVLVETQNSIYANYDYVREQSQNAQDLWKYQQQAYQPPTLEQTLAERCFDNGKQPKWISEYDIDKLIMKDQNGQSWYIAPEQVQSGMHIQLNCKILNMETGNISIGTLDIPNVQDFAYQDGKLIVESRSSIFTNVDFSKELDEIKKERTQEYQEYAYRE